MGSEGVLVKEVTKTSSIVERDKQKPLEIKQVEEAEADIFDLSGEDVDPMPVGRGKGGLCREGRDVVQNGALVLMI